MELVVIPFINLKGGIAYVIYNLVEVIKELSRSLSKSQYLLSGSLNITHEFNIKYQSE